jgi:transcriptional regulator with XRE-family HTH domain
MNAYEEIGLKLQKAREEAGMSQEELAKLSGCTQAAMSYYELGKRRLYFAQLKKISEILRRPITYFLDSSYGEGSADNDIEQIKKEPHLMEILLRSKELKPSQRKAVLEYIKWQKYKTRRIE